MGLAKAVVQATWSVNGTVVQTGQATTNRQGIASLSFTSKTLSSGDLVRLTVTNVTAAGYVYKPEDNEEGFDQVTIP